MFPFSLVSVFEIETWASKSNFYFLMSEIYPLEFLLDQRDWMEMQ